MMVASTASTTRPTSPPISCTFVTSDATRCSINRACGGFCPCGICRTSGKPGDDLRHLLNGAERRAVARTRT